MNGKVDERLDGWMDEKKKERIQMLWMDDE